MKRHKKALALVFSAMFLLASFGCAAAYAEEVAPVTPIIQEPDNQPEVPAAPDMPVEQPDDGGNEQPDYNAGGNEQPDYNAGGNSYVEPDYNNGGNYNSNNDYNYNNNNNNNNNYNNNNYNSNEYSYNGNDNESSNQTQPYQSQNTAPSAALYDVKEKKIDDKTLSGNDWSDIANQLKNAGNTPSAENDAIDDFAFIQQNTARDDNGHWIIIAGVACLALSVAGFIYLIASAVSRRNKMKTAGVGGSQNGGYYRANDDYDDGYKPAKKEKNPRNGKRYK